MASGTTIQCLNDDCLLRIFDLLNLSVEKQIRSVCSRFNNLILYLWSLRYRVYKRQEKMRKPDGLKWIVHCLGAFVEQLDLDYVTPEELQYLKTCGFIFPCMRKLQCLYFPNGYAGDVDLIQIVAHTFPQLTHLSVDFGIPMNLKPLRELPKLVALELRFNTTMCHYVPNFTAFAKLQLKRLRLDTNSRLLPFQEHNDDNVLQILNCSTLEELELSSVILKLVVSELHRWPKLRKVACVGPDDCGVFNEVLLALDKRALTVISSNSAVFFCSVTNLRHFKNVQKLMVFTRLQQKYNRSGIADNLGNLRELHFMDKDADLYFVNPSSMLSNVVSSCLKLVLLAVPISWVNKYKYISIAELMRILERQTGRKVPLELRFVRQKHEPDRIEGMEIVPANSKVLRLTTALYTTLPGFEYKKCSLAFQIVLSPDGDI